MIATLAATFLLTTSIAPDTSYLYQAVLVRAAPEALLEVIDLYQGRGQYYEASGDLPPFMMRHSQGDQWDLLLMFPMGSFAAYYEAERVARRERAGKATGMGGAVFEDELRSRLAWREDVFVTGPSLDDVSEAIEAGEFYHVEMFIALPGKHGELRREREMENAYLAALDRPQNLIFERVAGAAWDLFTIGVYRDIGHFAASDELPALRREAAAKAAGFEGADRIGTYLRTLIDSHHDTLARAVR
jgi:hypothetical protein